MTFKKVVIDNLRFLKLQIDKIFKKLPYRSLVLKFDTDVSFCVNGWIVLDDESLENVSISFIGNNERLATEDISFEVIEVAEDIKAYLHRSNNSNGKLYKIDARIVYESSIDLDVVLALTIDGKTKDISLGSASHNVGCGDIFKYSLCGSHVIHSRDNEPCVISFNNKSADCSSRMVDIILPIYNGYEYFEALFSSIVRTKCKYHLFIINDCSPDARVKDFLEEYKRNEEVTLIQNDENLGFVKSVNKGLEMTSNDVVLLNSDTELPDGWLERLMCPIWTNEKIASVTPFTNSGTICSFPKFCENNTILCNLSVGEIDSHFKKLKPKGYIVPTGVGFCMAMSRRAIKDVGFLDTKTFGKGFGEENDWCQRAICKGYENIHLNNLFVYHKHGGSFDEEDKRQLSRENTIKLLDKHPDYNNEVSFYIMSDPAYFDRLDSLWSILNESPNITYNLVIGNSFGGGGGAFIKTRIDEMVANNEVVVTFEYVSKTNLYCATVIFNDIIYECYFVDVNSAFDRFKNPKKIIINGLQCFSNLPLLLSKLIAIKNLYNTELVFYVHDYHCLCLWYNLTGIFDEYCGLPDRKICEKCFNINPDYQMTGICDIEEYRCLWSDFLTTCDDVVCFSNSSKDILKSVYSGLSSIIIKPHKDSYIQIENHGRKADVFTIGVMGVINEVKGFKKLEALVHYIDKKEIDARVVLIGYMYGEIHSNRFVETGAYTKDNLSSVIAEYPVDVFFFPSVCPETFSFVTSEIISINSPVVCFDLGAQAERISCYEKGEVIPLNSSPKEIFNALYNLAGELDN